MCNNNVLIHEGDLNNVKLSILCVSYNHERYLKEALDGILMQQVNFNYEIIIGDDCSTDDSQKIIKDYIPLFGDRITAILREKNIGAYENVQDIQSRAKGEYIIFLETDDKWTDFRKLQKQVDYLDSNSETIAVAHCCSVIDKYSKITAIRYPECNKEVYTLKDYRRWILPGQTATIMYRNYHKYDMGVDKKFVKMASKIGPGDRATVLALFDCGEIHCIQEVMSAYRWVYDEGSSFSANNKMKYRDYARYFKCYIDFSQRCNKASEISAVAEMLYIEALIAACISNEKVSIKNVLNEFRKMNNKIKICVYILDHIISLYFTRFKCRIKGDRYML